MKISMCCNSFCLCYNKSKVLYLTMTKDYRNFYKVADLPIERVRLKNVESPKFCETETIYQYRKKMAYTLFKMWLCVKISV